MKEVEKKDTPEVSGGYVGPCITDPFVTDPPIVSDYPKNPVTGVPNEDQIDRNNA